MAESLEPLIFKVSVLKVSIHCRGCMKKINKILKNTEGVAEVTIEPSLNKVTVKATVDSDVLIARLAKYGKHAEVWAQPKPSPTKDEHNSKAENQKSAEISKPKQPSEKSEKKLETSLGSADKQPDDTKKEGGVEKSSSEPAKKPKNEPIDKKISTEASKAEKKAEQPSTHPEKPVATATETTTTKTESKATAIDSHGIEDTEKSNGSSEKKSKEKKSTEETTDKSLSNHSTNRAIDNSMPMHNMYSYPPHSYPQQQPLNYVMSYNMSQPTASQSYYAFPMQPEPQGYMYQQYPPPQEYYYGSMEGNSSSAMRYRYNSYDDGMNVFNEEDPNSCSVM